MQLTEQDLAGQTFRQFHQPIVQAVLVRCVHEMNRSSINRSVPSGKLSQRCAALNAKSVAYQDCILPGSTQLGNVSMSVRLQEKRGETRFNDALHQILNVIVIQSADTGPSTGRATQAW